MHEAAYRGGEPGETRTTTPERGERLARRSRNRRRGFFPHEAWPAEMRDRLTGVTPDWRSRDLGAKWCFGVRVP